MKLLQTTIRRYSFFSFIILLLAIPLFYFLLKALVRKEMDEDLTVSKTGVVLRLKQIVADSSLNPYKYPDYNLSVQKSTDRRVRDSFYTQVSYDSIFSEQVPYRFLVSNVVINDQPFVIKIRASMVDYDNLIELVAGVQALLMLLLFFGLQFINRNLSRRIWQPFYTTLQKLRAYKVEEHQRIALPLSTINEFNDLNNAIAQLTQRNYKAFISQREFAENASHEMQTPLAILQSKLELLMQTAPLNDEQAELISSMADASQRLNRLNKALILLSRIENNQFTDKERVDLHQVIVAIAKQYEDLMVQKQIGLTVRVESPLQVEINKALAEILINNLFSNAVRHNVQGGTITIILNNNELVIQNTGKPVPLNEQRLFQRFQKDSTDHKSLGLGLEIAKKICDLNKFRIEYHFSNGMHTFRIFSELVANLWV